MPASYEIPSLTGDRVALRPIEPEEEIVVHRWVMESDLLRQTCRPPIHRSLAGLAAMRRRRGMEATRGDFAIVLRGTGTLIGRIRYFDLNLRNRSVEIGYILSPDARGKGFAHEAITLLTGYLFEGMGMNKVYAQTASFNADSIKLLESLGFRRDAVLREHHLYRGVFHDDYVYSILAREWAEVRGVEKRDPPELDPI
jgi:RimJ/RimL family protein N-acetyltransferase